MHTHSCSKTHFVVVLSEDELRALLRPADIRSMLWAAIALDPRVGTQIRLLTSSRFKGFIAIANREVLHALRQVGPKHQVDEDFIAEIALGREVQTAAAFGPPSPH
jgi:hypothetical protein